HHDHGSNWSSGPPVSFNPANLRTNTYPGTGPRNLKDASEIALVLNPVQGLPRELLVRDRKQAKIFAIDSSGTHKLVAGNGRRLELYEPLKLDRDLACIHGKNPRKIPIGYLQFMGVSTRGEIVLGDG